MSTHKKTFRLDNPDKTNLVPVFEYFPTLFAPEEAAEHRSYNEYILYNKKKRVYEVMEPVTNMMWEDGRHRLSELFKAYDINVEQCSEIKQLSYAPNLLCRN